MIKRTIHPLGRTTYDSKAKTLTFEDGVLEEQGKRTFVSPARRTYTGIESYLGGSLDLNSLPPTVCSMDLTPEERASIMEKIMARAPTLVSILKETSLSQLPRALATHVLDTTKKYISHRAREIKIGMRKRALQARVPHLDSRTLDDLAFDYTQASFSYATKLVEEALITAGEDSEFFLDVSQQLLTPRQRSRLADNLKRGEHPSWGILVGVDMVYAVRQAQHLFAAAKTLAERFSMGTGDYAVHLQGIVEASPLHKLSF
ncbi:MAG: hypothetical protein Q8L34_04020 [Candidatus Woesearchaeota archaeon]|nr:hypothetical protein [Candidatus Woesearchaeota archaeon]